MASISLKNIYKIYPGDVTAVKDFNLEIEDKEFIVLVGPSGCGKSTTLRMIAGLEEISKGELYIGDRLVNDVPPKDRDIAMVFQNYALYPHMTVYKNMAFGLELRKTPKDEINRRVREAARSLDIEHLLDRKPKALSGGQRQRVALGRAMVRNPAVFLLDEPLSNLDAKLRASMRVTLIQLHQRLGTTFVYVTHDQTEAMTMGDRIVVMKDGLVQQVDTPQHLYDSPCNVFVAGFMGSPQMNFIDGKLEKEGNDYFFAMQGDKLKLDDHRVNEAIAAYIDGPVTLEKEDDEYFFSTQEDKLKIDDPKVNEAVAAYIGEPVTLETEGEDCFFCTQGDKLQIVSNKVNDAMADYIGKPVKMGIRPEDLKDDEAFLAANPKSIIDAKVEVSELMGNEVYLYLDYKGLRMTARVAPDTSSRTNGEIKVAINTNKIHLFDPETELAIMN